MIRWFRACIRTENGKRASTLWNVVSLAFFKSRTWPEPLIGHARVHSRGNYGNRRWQFCARPRLNDGRKQREERKKGVENENGSSHSLLPRYYRLCYFYFRTIINFLWNRKFILKNKKNMYRYILMQQSYITHLNEINWGKN